MKRTTRSWATRSLARMLWCARGQLIVGIAVGLLVACGGDDGEGGDKGGSGTEQAGTPAAIPEPGTDYIISCMDQDEQSCNDYIGDESGRDEIEEVATDICKRYVSKLTTEPCPVERNVGTCMRTSQYGGVRYAIKIVFYPPLTAEAAKLQCGSGGKFQPAGG